MQNSELIQENETHKLLWYFEITWSRPDEPIDSQQKRKSAE